MSHKPGIALLIFIIVVLGLNALGVPLPLADLLAFASDHARDGAVIAVVSFGVGALIKLAQQ